MWEPGFVSGDVALAAVHSGRFGQNLELGPLPSEMGKRFFQFKTRFAMISCVSAALSPYPFGLKEVAVLAVYPLGVFA